MGLVTRGDLQQSAVDPDVHWVGVVVDLVADWNPNQSKEGDNFLDREVASGTQLQELLKRDLCCLKGVFVGMKASLCHIIVFLVFKIYLDMSQAFDGNSFHLAIFFHPIESPLQAFLGFASVLKTSKFQLRDPLLPLFAQILIHDQSHPLP